MCTNPLIYFVPAYEGFITEDFVFSLDEDFINFDDPSWWYRAHEELAKYEVRYETHNMFNPDDEIEIEVVDVPPVEWLVENAVRTLDEPYASIKVFFPDDGEIYKVVSYDDHMRHFEQYPHEAWETMKHTVVWNDTIYYTTSYQKMFYEFDGLYSE